MGVIEFWMGFFIGGSVMGWWGLHLYNEFKRGVEEATTSFFKSLEADHKEFMDWRTANGRY